MDRLLRPERFTTEPSDPDAEKRYRHWKMTFGNFLATSLPPVPTDATAETVRASNEQKKLFGLLNNISHSIYELIADATSYDAAITILDNTFIKPTSVIYNRHKLRTSKQEPMQSIDMFVQELHRVSKTCNFEAVSAEENRQQSVRDAFIHGMSSSSIRQRLLENNTLSLDEAVKQARALEQAQSQAASYENGVVVAAITPGAGSQASDYDLRSSSHQQLQQQIRQLQQQLQSQQIAENESENIAAVQNSNKCRFCGYDKHHRSQCPAREKTCGHCQKKGHFRRACEKAAAGAPAAAVLGAIPPPGPSLA